VIATSDVVLSAAEAFGKILFRRATMPFARAIIAIAATWGMGIIAVDVGEYYRVHIEGNDFLHEGLLI
jgi:hypothetical protein